MNWQSSYYQTVSTSDAITPPSLLRPPPSKVIRKIVRLQKNILKRYCNLRQKFLGHLHKTCKWDIPSPSFPHPLPRTMLIHKKNYYIHKKSSIVVGEGGSKLMELLFLIGKKWGWHKHFVKYCSLNVMICSHSHLAQHGSPFKRIYFSILICIQHFNKNYILCFWVLRRNQTTVIRKKEKKHQPVFA